jgi:hypothetical protein
MELQLSDKHILKLNSWLSFYSNENENASYTGIHAGIKHTLEKVGLYDAVYFKKSTVITAQQSVIDELTVHMKKNSINALWNLGVATGICWTLELFNILDTDFSNTDVEGF